MFDFELKKEKRGKRYSSAYFPEGDRLEAHDSAIELLQEC